MSGSSDTGTLNVNLDLDQLHTVLATQPRFVVTGTSAGKSTTLVEAVRTVRPGGLASDNQVNVLC